MSFEYQQAVTLFLIISSLHLQISSAQNFLANPTNVVGNSQQVNRRFPVRSRSFYETSSSAYSQDAGLLGSVFNSVQLGLKNMVDNLVPNFAVPEFPNLNLNANSGQNINAGHQTRKLPPLSVQLPAPFNRVFNGCPPCERLDPARLPGTWHMVYANENFLKSRFPAFTEIYKKLYGKYPDSNGPKSISGIALKKDGGLSPNLNDFGDFMRPMRYPLCATFQIGPASTVFLPSSSSSTVNVTESHSTILTYRQSHLSAPLISLSASLTRSQQKPTPNIYRLNLPNDNYAVDFCAVSSNIGASSFEGRLNVADQSRVLVLADAGAAWPTCQNLIVLTSDRNQFFDVFEPDVLRFVNDIDGDKAANPLQYTGCPI